jgi:phospholipid-transporting ATPase
VEIVSNWIELHFIDGSNIYLDSLKRMYRPLPYHFVQEIQKYNLPDYRPRMDRFRQAVNKVRRIQRLKRNRGYAFSQNDSDQTKIIRVYDTTQQKPLG